MSLIVTIYHLKFFHEKCESESWWDLLKFVTHRTNSSGPHALLLSRSAGLHIHRFVCFSPWVKGLSRCEPIRMDHGCISKWWKNKCDKINIIKPTKYFSSKVIYFPSITASEKTAIFFPIKFQQREMLLLENFTAEKGTTGITRDYSAQNSLPDPAARECETCMASNL